MERWQPSAHAEPDVAGGALGLEEESHPHTHDNTAALPRAVPVSLREEATRS